MKAFVCRVVVEKGGIWRSLNLGLLTEPLELNGRFILW